ncbi:hypothetical protein K466DRAFT_506853 [Polyporus arcularius HHB13444]|uniref:F-box domain-containing protein n=1 Tax=Polyporus arcularius HHB13444 TaxID=1314778 RepID=A0A5C3NRX7_9APHY|nr:hypothetical protein K466DRAFT_506853 [Polyporus arcularius HHB13444]
MATLRELPYIPLEVGENFIDQLSGHVDSLRSCALVCRGWNRHARQHLMVAIRVQSREDLCSIHEYFASNPRMASLVRSLCMASPLGGEKHRCLLEVLPVYLVKRLPNLQRYSIGRWTYFTAHTGSDQVSFHATALMHIKTYLHVEELHLEALRFRTSAELARVLIALPRLRRLQCRDLEADNLTADTSRFRNKCNMLSELTVVCTLQAIVVAR